MSWTDIAEVLVAIAIWLVLAGAAAATWRIWRGWQEVRRGPRRR